MRDVKFRVYDDGRMKYPEEYKENRFDNYFIDLNGQLRYYQNCYDGGFFDTDNAKLMQFTGLHDKNGKEIYEGDILQQVHYVFSNDEYDHKGFKKLIIQVSWGQKEAAFIFKVIKKIDIEMPKDYKEPYREVIGNIYENPELLKGADNIE